MFETVIIKPPVNPSESPTLGSIAETLLFYNKVHVYLSHQNAGRFVARIGEDNFFRLIERGLLTATYLRTQSVVISQDRGGITAHGFANVQLSGHKDRGQYKNDLDMLNDLLRRGIIKERLSKNFSRRFMKRVPRRSLGEEGLALARQDLGDPLVLRDLVGLVLNELVPDYALPNDWEFEAMQTPEGYIIGSTLDFSAINRVYHKKVSPRHSSVTAPFILANIVAACSDMQLACSQMAEISTSPIHSAIISRHVNHMLRKSKKTREVMTTFQNLFVHDTRTVAAVIDSGEKSFDDFMPVLENSLKFRDWLRKQNPDEDILREYVKETTSDTWISRLPARIGRYSLFTGAGIAADAFGLGGVGTAAGVALSAADAFFVERLVAGWRPSQFVSSQVADFIRENS